MSRKPDTPLKARARYLGLTQANLIRRTGLSCTTVSKAMNLDESVLVRHLRTVARSLGMELKLDFGENSVSVSRPADCRM